MDLTFHKQGHNRRAPRTLQGHAQKIITVTTMRVSKYCIIAVATSMRVSKYCIIAVATSMRVRKYYCGNINACT